MRASADSTAPERGNSETPRGIEKQGASRAWIPPVAITPEARRFDSVVRTTSSVATTLATTYGHRSPIESGVSRYGPWRNRTSDQRIMSPLCPVSRTEISEPQVARQLVGFPTRCRQDDARSRQLVTAFPTAPELPKECR
jgi:hypothetical protein